MFEEEQKIEQKLNVNGSVGVRKQLVSLYYYWPRQWVASMAWVANDFAFYGNKLQQNVFLGVLFPTVSTTYTFKCSMSEVVHMLSTACQRITHLSRHPGLSAPACTWQVKYFTYNT